MTTTNPDDKPLPGNVVTSLEDAPAALTGGPDLVPVWAYRPDGVKYAIQMSPKDAEAGGFELVNSEPEAKARQPKTASRSKSTAKDKSRKPKATKS